MPRAFVTQEAFIRVNFTIYRIPFFLDLAGSDPSDMDGKLNDDCDEDIAIDGKEKTLSSF